MVDFSEVLVRNRLRILKESMTYKRPTHRNVLEGDLLVVTTLGKPPFSIRPITEVDKTGVKVEYPERREFSIHYYSDALVLKRDGTYLIGKNVDVLPNRSRRKAR